MSIIKTINDRPGLVSVTGTEQRHNLANAGNSDRSYEVTLLDDLGIAFDAGSFVTLGNPAGHNVIRILRTVIDTTGAATPDADAAEYVVSEDGTTLNLTSNSDALYQANTVANLFVGFIISNGTTDPGQAGDLVLVNRSGTTDKFILVNLF